MTKLKIGDPVIVNHTDRPCAKHVAKITGLEEEYVQCEYLSALTRQDLPMRASHEQVTSLCTFGCIMNMLDYQYSVRCIRESEAKNATGTPRPWQEERNGSTQPLKQKWWIEK